ncbi:MAG TPA: hypothetical protein VF266_07165, partial [Thermoanaerobaculia bacterium]
MKKLCVIVLALCITSCGETDTKSRFLGRGGAGPRLSGGQDCTLCTAPAPPQGCGRLPPGKHAEAVRMLAEEPNCTDEVVEALQRFSRADSRARSDLGAAFYIRAKRYDQPWDLLRAYDALMTAPDTAAARVNRALVEEALGHKTNAPDPVAQWNAARDAALRSRDASTAAKLIAPFPGVAQVYFEDHLFEMDLAAAEIFAEALYRNTKDPLARDVVRAMRADRRGVAEFHVARGAQIASAPSEVTFGDAERLLSEAGNPLLLVARQRHAQVLTGGELAAPLSILDAIEPEARR